MERFREGGTETSCLKEVFPGGSVVKNPLAMQEPQEPSVRSLDQEDPLE